MRLSSKARYAVMAMAEMASRPTDVPISLSTIAECQELPLAYLEQLFIKLRRSGLVSSSRGAAGGYRLSRAAELTNILDIMASVDHIPRAIQCSPTSGRGCRLSGIRCLTHDLWDELGHVVQRFLKQTTLADIVQRRISSFPVKGFMQGYE